MSGRSVHPAWKTLGIEPTSDTRAIRSAYARRLKAFDPDADPQAFVALREARDLALRLANHSAPARPQAETASEAEESVDAEREPETVPLAEMHARALYSMLYAERDPAMPNATAAEREAMLEHWEAIAADPRIQEIGFFAQLEHWAIGLIASTVPLSDPLIIPATELFDWTASDDSVAQSREVAAITSRYGWLSYVEDVQQPDHPWHPLWEELTKPGGPGAKRGRLGPARVRALLNAVRAMRPDLEHRFDPARVALWEPQEVAESDFDPTAPEFVDNTTRNLNIMAVIGYAVLVIVIMSLMFGKSSRPEPLAPEPMRPAYAQPVAMPEPLPPREQRTVTAPSPSTESLLELARAYEKQQREARGAEPGAIGNFSQ